MEQKDIMSRKSDAILNGEKLVADTKNNIIPINILKKKGDPNWKVSLSSVEMANTMQQKDIMSKKSDAILNGEKLLADTKNNSIPINILNRPSSIKEYRYNEFERSAEV